MSVIKNPENHLTKNQEREAVALYLVGVGHYTDIAKRLGVPYQAVNTYMTKWKKDNGILKTRRQRSDKKVKTPAPKNVIDLDSYRDTLSKGIWYELEFLRRFYLAHVKGKFTDEKIS